VLYAASDWIVLNGNAIGIGSQLSISTVFCFSV